MNKEKLIKIQARQALKGNIVPIIAGCLLVCLVAILIENAFSWVLIALNWYDFSTDEVKSGFEFGANLLEMGVFALGWLFSPLVNGTVFAAANAAIHKKNAATDIFRYFTSPKRYFKTLVLNLLLLLLFSVPAALFNFPQYVEWIFGDSLTGFWAGAAPVLANVCMAVMMVLIYMIFVHYPLMLYAVDDSMNPLRCAFGFIGFSFRHFGALFKLLLSMFGWIALCFFVAPMFYSVPYLLVACANSARWLYSSRKA